MNIRQAHDHCATLAGATRDIKWETHAVFSVDGRMFAMFTLDGARLVDRLSIKVDDARFLELTDRAGIVPAPYLARARWVLIEGLARLSTDETKALLKDAHRLIATKLSKARQRTLFGDVASTPLASAARP